MGGRRPLRAQTVGTLDRDFTSIVLSEIFVDFTNIRRLHKYSMTSQIFDDVTNLVEAERI